MWRKEPPSALVHTYLAKTRASAVRGWSQLYLDEHDSVVITSFVTAELARVGAPIELLREAARVLEDEVRHVAVCARVLEVLGAERPTIDYKKTRTSLGEIPLRQHLIAGYAVGETMSAAVFAKSREIAEEPIAKWAFTEILRDEARHGGFGEKVGAWLLRDASPSERQQLFVECAVEMESFETRLGGPLNDELIAREERVDDRVDQMRLGLLPSSISIEAALNSIERWVLPRLQRLGVVPTAAA